MSNKLSTLMIAASTIGLLAVAPTSTMVHAQEATLQEIDRRARGWRELRKTWEELFNKAQRLLDGNKRAIGVCDAVISSANELIPKLTKLAQSRGFPNTPEGQA